MSYRCSKCGTSHSDYVAQCPFCHTWGTVRSEFALATKQFELGQKPPRSIPMPRIEQKKRERLSSLDHFDEVMGGGLVYGASYFLHGPPGIGKSTLGMQVAGAVARGGITVLYVSTELDTPELRMYADRLGCCTETLRALKGALSDVVCEARACVPSLIVVDSIDDLEVEGERTGSALALCSSVSQLKALATELRAALLMVGHIVKDGSASGPEKLGHLVDGLITLTVEGLDATEEMAVADDVVRLCRTWKNRFGPLAKARYRMSAAGLIVAEDLENEQVSPPTLAESSRASS